MNTNENLWSNVHKASKIYILPNFFTAGNLFFGFSSMVLCILARFNPVADSAIHKICKLLFSGFSEHNDVSSAYFLLALLCILCSVFCDALDGRVARASGKSSLFGKEFDSIADTVSFGVAPCLLTILLILKPVKQLPDFMQEYMGTIGFFIGFIYLLCACVRLSRFNVLTCPYINGHEKYEKGDFVGLPAPAAAGVIVSISLTLLTFDLKAYTFYLIPLLVLLTSWFMVSNIPYPSFKHINWNTSTKFRSFVFIIILAIAIIYFKEYSFSFIFLAYAFYSPIKYIPKLFKIYKYLCKRRKSSR